MRTVNHFLIHSPESDHKSKSHSLFLYIKSDLTAVVCCASPPNSSFISLCSIIFFSCLIYSLFSLPIFRCIVFSFFLHHKKKIENKKPQQPLDAVAINPSTSTQKKKTPHIIPSAQRFCSTHFSIPVLVHTQGSCASLLHKIHCSWSFLVILLILPIFIYFSLIYFCNLLHCFFTN